MCACGLPPRCPLGLLTWTARQCTSAVILARARYAQEYGTSAADFAKLRKFAKQYGLAVVEESAARHTSVLAGTAEAFSRAFGVTLRYYAHANGSYRGRVGPIRLPKSLAGIVRGVFGLDNRSQAQPRFQMATAGARPGKQADPASFTPPALARIYNFPTGH